MFKVYFLVHNSYEGIMRKINININKIKDQIETLKGKEIKMRVNRGRRRIEYYDGVIETIYPSVFTVKTNAPNYEIMSYSYSEVLCGDVKISIKSLK